MDMQTGNFADAAPAGASCPPGGTSSELAAEAGCSGSAASFEEELARLWRAGAGIHEIARRLGVSVSTVKYWRMKLRLEPRGRRLSGNEEMIFLAMARAGAADRKIALMLGLSVKQVGNRRRYLQARGELPAPKKPRRRRAGRGRGGEQGGCGRCARAGEGGERKKREEYSIFDIRRFG